MAYEDWAVNQLKLQRAIAEVTANETKENKKLTPKEKETAVKEVYIRLAGLVIESEAEPTEDGQPQVKVTNVIGSRKNKIRKTRK